MTVHDGRKKRRQGGPPGFRLSGGVDPGTLLGGQCREEDTASGRSAAGRNLLAPELSRKLRWGLESPLAATQAWSGQENAEQMESRDLQPLSG